MIDASELPTTFNGNMVGDSFLVFPGTITINGVASGPAWAKTYQLNLDEATGLPQGTAADITLQIQVGTFADGIDPFFSEWTEVLTTDGWEWTEVSLFDSNSGDSFLGEIADDGRSFDLAFDALGPGSEFYLLLGLTYVGESIAGGSQQVFNLTASTVPEPASLALLGVGLGLACFRSRRDRSRRSTPASPAA